MNRENPWPPLAKVSWSIVLLPTQFVAGRSPLRTTPIVLGAMSLITASSMGTWAPRSASAGTAPHVTTRLQLGPPGIGALEAERILHASLGIGR